MVIFHFFPKNNRLITNPKARPRMEYDWDHESKDLGTAGRHQAFMLPMLLLIPETSPEGKGLG